MKSFFTLGLATLASAASLASSSTDTCVTEMGTDSVGSVPTATSTATSTVTVTVQSTLVPSDTVTPEPVTSTTTQYLTLTESTTLSESTDTLSVTTTIFESLTVTETDTLTETNTATTTLTQKDDGTTTIGTVPGFTPLASALPFGWTASKRTVIEKRVIRWEDVKVPRKGCKANIPKPKPQPVSLSPSDVFFPNITSSATANTASSVTATTLPAITTTLPANTTSVLPSYFPANVLCSASVYTTVSETETITATTTDLSTAIPVTSITTLSSTLTVTSTASLDAVSTTTTISTTSTLTNTVTTTTTTTQTVTSTINVVQPGATVYGACQPNNLITSVNGRAILGYNDVAQPFIQTKTDSATACCALCQASTTCASFGFVTQSNAKFCLLFRHYDNTCKVASSAGTFVFYDGPTRLVTGNSACGYLQPGPM